jgi:hypothetical protein
MSVETAPITQERVERAAWPAGWCGVLTHTHTYSGRSDHGGVEKAPRSYREMAAWALRCGIAAVAMGSPYTAKSAATYDRFDGDERDLYYGPDFDKLSVCDADEIQTMLREVAGFANGHTLFFLDNETPKGRYGHMWWVGHQPDFPAWHDYDQPYDRWMLGQPDPADHGDEPMAYERRPYLQILASQRARGALGFWAHPTSWWRDEAGRFITNIATELPVHVMAEGFTDGMVIMGYHPYRPQYLALWFELLDRGYRVPGVAEMDVGLSDARLWQRDGALLTYIRGQQGNLSVPRLVEGFRSGRMFASSGPFLDLLVDGKPMGQVTATSPTATHRIQITAYPAPGKAPLGRLELVGRGGRVLWQREDFGAGTVEISLPGLSERGYLVARALGSDADPAQWRDVRQVAISNPVYLHPHGERFTPAMQTMVRLTIREDSPYKGGQIRFEAMDGQLLDVAAAKGELNQSLPASGRITLIGPDGRRRTDYLANANPALQAVQRHLYRGRFLLDHPHLHPGEVPPEVWRLDEYCAALQRVELAY